MRSCIFRSRQATTPCRTDKPCFVHRSGVPYRGDFEILILQRSITWYMYMYCTPLTESGRTRTFFYRSVKQADLAFSSVVAISVGSELGEPLPPDTTFPLQDATRSGGSASWFRNPRIELTSTSCTAARVRIHSCGEGILVDTQVVDWGWRVQQQMSRCDRSVENTRTSLYYLGTLSLLLQAVNALVWLATDFSNRSEGHRAPRYRDHTALSPSRLPVDVQQILIFPNFFRPLGCISTIPITYPITPPDLL
ncbi:hypothetical protein B0J18DRAFT_96893 [Chaetomium sp. MPI-SDFR-AT-0129]|nr:hypothetical protein B0J18DRAFT_96893 [Chaetomium sp. MPI-SDFR-AT-0129]